MTPLPSVEVHHLSTARSMQTQIPVKSATLRVSANTGIIVGGALILFVIIITVALTLMKGKHRFEARRMSKIKESSLEDTDLRATIRSTRPPEIRFSRRLSFNPFLPRNEGISSHEWASHGLVHNPSMVKAKRQSFHKGAIRIMGGRESWPLISNIKPVLLPGQSSIIPSQVAPLGSIVEDSKVLKHSSLRLSRQGSTFSQETINSQADPEAASIALCGTLSASEINIGDSIVNNAETDFSSAEGSTHTISHS
ncbi:hypothetical protein BGZ60DRAFT_425248 [Tricladium varicosporioides]|nr:hypothetical protein BGZ60DRAFT_425248 [Hymenoscyphus varicosporioides]